MKRKLFSILALLLIAVVGATAQTTNPVTVKEGTVDAEKWTADPNPAEEGQTVTVTYTGTKKVIGLRVVRKAPAEEPVTQATPLTLKALSAGTITVSKPKSGMQYALNGGEKVAMTSDTSIPVAKGDRVAFYGDGTTITSYNSTKIQGSGDGFRCEVYGNIMSLVDETGYEEVTTLSGTNVFRSLFADNTALTDASKLQLPATKLVQACYQGMFQDCSALTTAPVLPAEKLPNICYNQMFKNCVNLSSVTCLATDLTSSNYPTNYWLQNAGTSVTGPKTFTAASTTDWPFNDSGIPVGWTRLNPDGTEWTPPTVDLSTLTEDVTLISGTVVSGTLSGNYKVSIAPGATVTLDNVTINGTNDENCPWAGLTCEGAAIIILKGKNTVTGFHQDYPGIQAGPTNTTLTIMGDGSLTAMSNGQGCGIGGGYNIDCGNINIKGGNVTATGGEYAAGIGSGYNGSCADIIIAIEGVTITATKGTDAPNSIGKGAGDDATSGYVVFGINVKDPVETSPFTYTGGDYDGSGNGGTYIVVDP